MLLATLRALLRPPPAGGAAPLHAPPPSPLLPAPPSLLSLADAGDLIVPVATALVATSSSVASRALLGCALLLLTHHSRLCMCLDGVESPPLPEPPLLALAR